MIMSGEKFYRIYNGTTKQAWLVPLEEINTFSGKKSYFVSTGYYTKEQKAKFLETGTVAGVETKTNQIWFDFDSKMNPEDAVKDAIKLCTRLYKHFKIDEVERYFSGYKGIHVVVKLQDELTSSQVKKIITKLGIGLSTLDLKVYDSARVLRLPNTLHESTGLYKIPLLDDDLFDGLDKIKELAKQPRDLPYKFRTVQLPQELLVEDDVKQTKKEVIVNPGDPLRIKEIDFSQKPVGWPDYKWSLAQGRFEIGNRNHSLMIVAATCKALKYGREHTEAICMAADKMHCEITGDDSIERLEKEILDVVFSPNWKGGSYSPENDLELRQYCDKHGFNVTKNLGSTIDIKEAFQIYKNFKKNSGTYVVDTGIPSLNKAARITVGQVVGIVAGPAVGKSSLAIQILNAMSKKPGRTLFFSYDMYIALVIQKLMQKHTNLTEDEIDRKIGNLSFEEEREITDILAEEYGNVSICFESGQSVNEIISVLKKERELHGDVSLVIIDYNELISSQNSDSTEASKEVAQKLRALANNHNVCIIVLMQPNKISGGPTDEIKSYRSIKGSSMSEQSLDLALGLSRPGFDPEFPEDDKFLVVNCLKNRYGKLFRLELLFDGYNGKISEIKRPEDRLLLEEIKQRKQQKLEEAQDNNNQNGGGFRRPGSYG